MPRGVLAIAIGREAGGHGIVTGRPAFEDRQKQPGSQNPAEDLPDDVTGNVLCIDLLAAQQTDGHGRIDVTPGMGPRRRPSPATRNRMPDQCPETRYDRQP